MLDLIYSSGGNSVLMQIAYEAGYLLGIRSDYLDYGFPISFVDIHYKHPDFKQHLQVCKRLQPKYATIPDLSENETTEQDIARAVKQADELSDYCEHVLLVPKRSEQISLIPDRFVIAYSIPSSYGGAKYGVWKLEGRRVHLLGGSPHAQMKLYRYFGDGIMSADGNMAQLLAITQAEYWQGKRWRKHPQHGQGIPDLYLDCWRRSCENIRAYWQQIG